MVLFPSINDHRIVELLKSGKIGVVPTDTIYGLAALASDEDAVLRLYGLKHRKGKPGTLIAANVDQLIELGLDEQVVKAVSHLWPNPVSVVIPCSPELDYLDQGLGDLAVRVPALDELRSLLEETGPVLTSSANHPGEAPANNVAEAYKYFGDTADFYVEGGDLSGRPPSTVVKFANNRFTVLRKGPVEVQN